MEDSAAMNMASGWDRVLTFLADNGVDSGTVVSLATNLLKAVVIFYVGRIAIGLAIRALRKLMRKQEIDATLESFVCNVVRTALLIMVVIAAIGALGIETTSFIAIFGAASLAIGLALQGSLSNFASGVLIVLFRPYRVGDFIEAAGVTGSVEQVQILTTVLKTGDNKKVIVPNSQIMNSIITNYSANDTRRVDMVVGVGYEDDLDKVRSTLEDLLNADTRILADPAPKIAVSELAEGISFPYPQQDVHLYRAVAD